MGDRRGRYALHTDLYQLTMAAALERAEIDSRATFELFVRSLPPHRSFLVAAGLEQALEYLEGLSFSEEEVSYISGLPAFSSISESFFDLLRGLRFQGDVWAIPEGTPVFAGEPLVRISAPAVQAQLVETTLLSLLNFQTLVATKATRIVEEAGDRGVLEFGSRRAHGPEAGVFAARAAFVGGCAGTSNVEAGYRWGIPVAGTVAHSFVMMFEDEQEAFARYHDAFPDSTVLLIDTYDTERAAGYATQLGAGLKGVRVDSGDLTELTRKVRRVLDRAGQSKTRIFASSDLDEHKIRELVAQGAPIDAFGVGTELATSRDAPALGGVYKLVEVEGRGGDRRGVAKRSEGKRTWPWPKQVYRVADTEGVALHDLVCLASEPPPGSAQPLLTEVMATGKRTGRTPTLDEIRERRSTMMGELPERYRRLEGPERYPVMVSERMARGQS